jgi:hypothetical protein
MDDPAPFGLYVLPLVLVGIIGLMVGASLGVIDRFFNLAILGRIVLFVLVVMFAVVVSETPSSAQWLRTLFVVPGIVSAAIAYLAVCVGIPKVDRLKQ